MESRFKFGSSECVIGKKAYVMGILNVTPDSFSDGGKYFFVENAVKRAYEIEAEGADFLDIGAQSTRPGSAKISEKEELSRLISVLDELSGKIKIPISVDTFYSGVAKESLKRDTSIINNVSTFDDEMFKVAADSDCGIIVTHCFSNIYSHVDYFCREIDRAKSYGISEERICLDVGIGFGKTFDEDLEILRFVEKFRVCNRPILVGCSRKRVIRRMTGNNLPSDNDFGTVAANIVSAGNGGDIFRVHNVRAVVEGFKVFEQLRSLDRFYS